MADADFDDLPHLFSLLKQVHFNGFSSAGEKNVNNWLGDEGEILSDADVQKNFAGVVSDVLRRLPPGTKPEFRGEAMLFLSRIRFSLLYANYNCIGGEGGGVGVGSSCFLRRKERVELLLRNSVFREFGLFERLLFVSMFLR